MAVLASARSDAPDPRLDRLLAAIRREWVAIARVRFRDLGDELPDVVQTALMKVLDRRKLDSLADRSLLDRWARSVFVNTALDFVRQARCRTQRMIPTDDDGPEAFLDALPAPGGHPEEVLIREERLKIIRRSLERLDVARLRYGEDLSEREIADRIGGTRDAVASRLKRFRHWLREELAEDG